MKQLLWNLYAPSSISLLDLYFTLRPRQGIPNWARGRIVQILGNFTITSLWRRLLLMLYRPRSRNVPRCKAERNTWPKCQGVSVYLRVSEDPDLS